MMIALKLALLGLILAGVPICLIEARAGRRDRVVAGQQAILLALAVLIWAEVL